MLGPSARQLDRLAAIRQSLDTIRLDEPLVLPLVVGDLRELLAADASVAYRAVDGLDFCHADGIDETLLAERLRALGPPATWSAYDPAKPPLAQRNRVFSPNIEHYGRSQYEKLPVVRDVYRAVQIHEMDTLRVLVCDGSTLLAWIGAYRERPFGARERMLLAELTPSLQRRLVLERRLQDCALHAAGLTVALEAIPTATVLVSRAGAVRFANAAGQRLLDEDRGSIDEELGRSIRSPNSGAPFSVLTVAMRGLPDHYLAVQRAQHIPTATRATIAARAWRLTRRQTEVLGLLLEGYGNKAIAESLGCATHTAELHVSAILEKACVDSRAAVVAKVWSDDL